MFATAQANEFNQVRDRFFFQRPWKPRIKAELSSTVDCKCSQNMHEVSKMTTSFKGTCCQGGVSNFSHGTHTHVIGCRQLKRYRED